MKKQFVEGKLAGCAGRFCEDICCDDNKVIEWVVEYLAYHDNIKDHLLSHGINIEFKEDRVYFTGCSDGKKCKFLKYALNKNVDPRPIDCKIYPFVVDWDTIDFDKKIVKLYYWDNTCPLVKQNKIPLEFRKEVENIITRDFAFLFFGAKFKVKFMADVYKHKN